MRLCQYPVSQRPIPRCGILASPLQLLPPGSSYSKFLLSLFCVYYLEVFKGKLVLFPPLFIFNGLFLSACTHGYLFYSLGCCDRNLYFILLLNLFQLWPLEVFSGCLLCSLSGTSPCYFPLRLEYFLGPGTTQCSCSSCASLAPILEASTSPGDCSSVLWLVHWKMVFVV